MAKARWRFVVPVSFCFIGFFSIKAFILLEEIKQSLFDLLLPQHTKIKQQISEVLDIPLIKQKAEKGILDFKVKKALDIFKFCTISKFIQYYANYVISIMAKMCAQVRDEKIQQLRETTDIVEVYKGILEVSAKFLFKLDFKDFSCILKTLELMQLDMANFTLQMIKPDIINHSVELEREKFANYLAVQPGK